LVHEIEYFDDETGEIINPTIRDCSLFVFEGELYQGFFGSEFNDTIFNGEAWKINCNWNLRFKQ
jgi:hypothetical protein